MAKCYFDPTIPFGICERPSFYAYPVDVPQAAIEQAKNLRRLLEGSKVLIRQGAFPNQAQEFSDYFVAEFEKIMKKRKTDVKSNTESPVA